MANQGAFLIRSKWPVLMRTIGVCSYVALHTCSLRMRSRASSSTVPNHFDRAPVLHYAIWFISSFLKVSL